MLWTELHSSVLARAFERVLRTPERGTMAFARCLPPGITGTLAEDSSFAPKGWNVLRVSDVSDEQGRTVTADRAVEAREEKAGATLLLVDTERAGAGMDGIFSAAREVDETKLFEEALRIAAREVGLRLSRDLREYANLAINRAQVRGRFAVSPLASFDFLCRIATERCHPGAQLQLLGLWPVQESEETTAKDDLDISRRFVDRLLGPEVASLAPRQRIEELRLLDPTQEQRRDLERFLHSASEKPLLDALPDLAVKKRLWVNALEIERAAQSILEIVLTPWRTKGGKIAKWSGLSLADSPDDPPVLFLSSPEEAGGEYGGLEIRWKARPDNLEKNAAEYSVAVVTGHDEELASSRISHSAKKEERLRFSNDDFDLSEDALISAKVVVSAVSTASVESQESEEFIIRFGQRPESPRSAVGKVVRAFSEGLVNLGDRNSLSELVFFGDTDTEANRNLRMDSKGFLTWRIPQLRRSFKVFRPSLIHETERQWIERLGEVGRWRVKVRPSGERAGSVEFVPFDVPQSSGVVQPLWDRAVEASRRMAEKFKRGGGVAQVYDDKSAKNIDPAKEFILAWTALLDAENAAPCWALVNTIEVQSLSGKRLGLIIPPSHPLRVAWHCAYDNLVFYAVFEDKRSANRVCEELRSLDGAMFPATLPSPNENESFVFADTLGFHATGMILDHDTEPKATLAVLARALADNEAAEVAPTVGKKSAAVLGDEINRYLKCHYASRLLHLHAVRAGDGLTVSRALGLVLKDHADDSDSDTVDTAAPSFVLEFYPSPEQSGVAGQFIAEAAEKRRRGAGVVAATDRWMLESRSLPGGVHLPKLRWARKQKSLPEVPAHLTAAFDTFDSRVEVDDSPGAVTIPLHAFGLLSFFNRDYIGSPVPSWRNTVLVAERGEKHPSERGHSERLLRLQRAVQKSTARNLGSRNGQPVLKTEVSSAKEQGLHELHRLSDWVITLDRNAGVEYFDSPRDNEDVYNTYVIDCVPERDDLGCMQLITSTSNLDEVLSLVNDSLDRMGLSRSTRNAKFLLEHLKALSGRLAIRLTGLRVPSSELVALAASRANCLRERESDGGVCWTPLEAGFLIPVDDVRDLLPPLDETQTAEVASGSRPDLIHVSAPPPRGRLRFRFIEVKHRQHLRAARTPSVLHQINAQVESLRKSWNKWYGTDTCRSFRAVRRAKLARVLRFYADKARRHYLQDERHQTIVAEIDRMLADGERYEFREIERDDRGWIFCPEYSGTQPLEISPTEWSVRIFLFGHDVLPDSNGQRETIGRPDDPAERGAEQPSLAPPLETPNKGGDGERVSGRPDDPTRVESKVPEILLGFDSVAGAEARLPLTVRGNPHLLVAGLPGMGKTTLLLNLCEQMVAAGIRPIVFSYHQDIDEKLAESVGEVRFVDFDGLGFNPLQVLDRGSPMAYLDVAGAVRDIFTATFPDIGHLQGERIRKAIRDSFIEAGWDSRNAAAEFEEPPFQRFVEILQGDPKPDRGLRALLARLAELDDYDFFTLRNPQGSLWDSDHPIVIRVHKTQNDNLQRAFAHLVFYGLYKDMFRRGVQERITHALVLDEAHRAAELRLIPKMAKECRKYGISLALASQGAKDFDSSLFSAVANYLVMKLPETDAKALVKNVSDSREERRLIDTVKRMENFEALYFRVGTSKPSHVTLLGPTGAV